MDGGACGDFAGPADHAWDADSAFVEVAFSAAQSSGGAATWAFVSVAFRAVIGGEKDKGILGELEVIEDAEELAKSGVHLGDIGVVFLLEVVWDVGVQGFKSGIGLDGVMGFVGPDGEEEGFGGVAFLAEPLGGFLDNERRGVALEFSCGGPVADEVFGVFVGRRSVVLSGHPPVVAVVTGLGLCGVVKEAVEMPFSGVAGGVAGGFEEGREGDFAFSEMNFGSFSQPGKDAVSVGGAAGEECGAGGAADGAGGVALGKPGTLLGKGVEVGSFDRGMTETTEVAVTEVVGEEKDDIGWGCVKGYGAEAGKGEQGAVHR